MEQSDNVRIVLEGYEAWNRGDLEAILEDIPPEFEFVNSGAVPGLPAVLHGHGGIVQLFRDWYTEPWDGPLQMSIHEIHELDPERVLTLITFRGRGRESGIEVELRYAHLHTISDGVNIRTEGFDSWGAGLRAAGLSSKR